MSGCPPEVQQFSDAMVRVAKDSLSLELDFTPETLPFLDHYRKHVIDTEGMRDGKDGNWRAEFLQLVAPMAACYFGEVLRRSHDTRWIIKDPEDPGSWRMEFIDCFLYFTPMGMAVESFLERQIEGIPGAFQVTPEQRKGVANVLDALPQVQERDFWAFTIRWETLDLISVHLIQDKVIKGDEQRTFSTRDYERHLELIADE